MSSSPSYDASVAFLQADVLDTIELEQPGLLPANGVSISRAPRGSWPRRTNPPAVSVEVVARGEAPIKAIGIGYDEVSQVFDLMCCVRKTAPSTGAEQLDVAEDLARALLRRYRLVANLAIDGATATWWGPFFPRPWFSTPFFGPSVVATRFLRSDAKRIEIDAEPEKGGRVRAVTRVTFTFLERRAENA